MVRFNSLRAAALVATLSATPALAAPPQLAKGPDLCTAGDHGAVAGRLQHALDAIAASPHTRGALLRVECRGQVWSLAGGVADVRTGRSMQPDERFRAGSNLKLAISAVVLQLVEEGRVSLDDPITRRLPTKYTAGFKDADAITVRMLLCHRSGIGEWTEAPGVDDVILKDVRKVWTPEEYIALAVAQGPKFKPGATYAYNNTEYELLGVMIEQLTGRSWRDNVLDRIFKPIGLTAAALPPPGVKPGLGGFAHGYRTVDGRELDVTDIDPSMAGAAGGHAFAPTTAELSRLLDALLAGRFFKHPETLALLEDFQPTGEPPPKPIGYGMGLGKYPWYDGLAAYGHTGSTGGYLSFVIRIPELDVTISGAVTSETLEDVLALEMAARKVVVEGDLS